MHYVIYYINEYKFNIIIRRLDAQCGWGVNLKIKIYSTNIENTHQIISLGSSEKNYKKMNINCNIKLYKLTYFEQNIPKVIIQTSYSRNIENILHQNSILTYIELNPEYKYKFFDNNEARVFIKNNFEKNILIAYDLLIAGAFKADFFRYCYLYINGGCYFDCKSILRIPLSNIIDKNDNFILCKDIGEGYFNAVILSIPMNDLLLKTINMCVDNIYNFYSKYNIRKDIYNSASSILSLTGPVLLYNAVKNYVNNNNIKLMHKHYPVKKYNYNHDYQSLYIDYNGKHIITKAYKSYHSSSGVHYSDLWYQKEVVYELSNIIDDKHKFYKFIKNINDKFDFYVFSENILIIEKTTNIDGWADFLKIKIINEETDKEYMLDIGTSNTKEKLIYLNTNFLWYDKIFSHYTFNNIEYDQNLKISLCKNKYNVQKLIVINDTDIIINENLNLTIILKNDNQTLNICIEKFFEKVKIINI